MERGRPRGLLFVGRAVFVVVLLLLGGACSEAGDEPNVERSGSGDRSEPAVVAGFDGSTIRVGMLVPSSGPSAETPAERAVGVKAYLDYVNTELGGIGGRYAVQVEVRDSADPDTIEARYRELRDASVLLAQVQGHNAVETLAPLLAADGVLAGPAPADLAWVRSPNLLQVGPPEQIVGASALAWLVDHGVDGASAHLCSAVQTRSGNDAWQAGIDRAATELAVSVDAPVTVPASPRDTAAVEGPVDRLRAAGCTAVFLGAGAAGTVAVLQAAERAAFSPQWVVPASSAGGALGEAGIEAYVAEHLVVVGSGPTADPPAGLRELLRIHEGYAPGEFATPAFTEGYLQGKAIVAVLEAAVSRGDLSRAGVLGAAARLRSVPFDEVASDAIYGPPERRRPMTGVGIAAPAADEPTRLRWVDLDFVAPVAEELAAGSVAG